MILALLLVSVTGWAKKKNIVKTPTIIGSLLTVESERYEVGIHQVLWVDYLYDNNHCELEMPYSYMIGRIIFSIREIDHPVLNGVVLSDTRTVEVSTNLGDFFFLYSNDTWIALQKIE